MKKITFIICFFAFSCNFTGDNNQDKAQTPEKAVSEPSNSETTPRDYRNNWQKPNFVLDQLGDLNGKTIADIGAGELGYFVLQILAHPDVAKVIAIDIDPEAVDMLNNLKNALPELKSVKLDIRLADEDDPKLNKEEVDIIIIVNTIAYINNRNKYLKNLKETLKENGKIIIVDFKTKRIPEFVGAPPYSERSYLHVIEEELYAAEFRDIHTDDTSLEYQYLICATK